MKKKKSESSFTATHTLNFPKERNLIINAHLASNLLIFRFIEKTFHCRFSDERERSGERSTKKKRKMKIFRAVFHAKLKNNQKQWGERERCLSTILCNYIKFYTIFDKNNSFTRMISTSHPKAAAPQRDRLERNIHSLKMKNILLGTRVPSHERHATDFFPIVSYLFSPHFNWIKWRIFIRGASWSNL